MKKKIHKVVDKLIDADYELLNAIIDNVINKERTIMVDSHYKIMKAIQDLRDLL